MALFLMFYLYDLYVYLSVLDSQEFAPVHERSRRFMKGRDS